MAKAKIVWWRGYTAELLQKVLAMDSPELHGFRHPGALAATLRKLWRAQVQQLCEIDTREVPVTKFGWGLTQITADNLLACTTALGRVAYPRHCKHLWSCPNCYAREVWSLIKLLKDIREPVNIQTEEEVTDDYRDLKPLWGSYYRRRRSELRAYPSSLVWQFITPNTIPPYEIIDPDIWYPHTRQWVLRRVLITPGELPTDAILRRLPSVLYYPWAWLTGDPRTAACAMAFMRQVRGRSLAGAWKKMRVSIEDLPF